MSQLLNQSATTQFEGEPRLHRVCQKQRDLQTNETLVWEEIFSKSIKTKVD